MLSIIAGLSDYLAIARTWIISDFVDSQGCAFDQLAHDGREQTAGCRLYKHAITS